MHQFGKALVLTALVISFSQATLAGQHQTYEDETTDISLGMEFRVDFSFVPVRIIQPIDDVPASIRQVPIRLIDSQPEAILTIPDSSLDPGRFSSGSFSLAPEIKFGLALLRGGIRFKMPFSPRASRDHGGSTRYLNSTVQDASVFYAIQTTNRFKPGWFGEVEISLTETTSLLAGYARNPYKVQFVSGRETREVDEEECDSFRNRETFKKFPLARNTLRTFYGGLRIYNRDRTASFVVLGGRVTQTINPTALGIEIPIEYGLPAFMLSVGVSGHWDW